jgi:hypothetical protein
MDPLTLDEMFFDSDPSLFFRDPPEAVPATPPCETFVKENWESLVNNFTCEKATPIKPQAGKPILVQEYQPDPQQPFKRDQFWAPNPPLSFIVPQDIWDESWDYRNRVKAEKHYQENRGGGTPADIAGGKMVEFIWSELATKLGFPKLPPDICVYPVAERDWKADFRYSKIPGGFPDVHVKSSHDSHPFKSGTFQLKPTDDVFTNGTETSLSVTFHRYQGVGFSWDYHPGRSTLMSLVVFGTYRGMDRHIENPPYPKRYPPAVDLYAVFPFRYLFDFPLLQKHMKWDDDGPYSRKLCFYYENLLYFQGRSQVIWDTEANARIPVPTFTGATR